MDEEPLDLSCSRFQKSASKELQGPWKTFMKGIFQRLSAF
jgi:hypothetical protein